MYARSFQKTDQNQFVSATGTDKWKATQVFQVIIEVNLLRGCRQSEGIIPGPAGRSVNAQFTLESRALEARRGIGHSEGLLRRLMPTLTP